MNFLKNRPIKTQFNLIVMTLLISCMLLGSLVDYTVQKLLLDNKSAHVKNTASRFESEINYLFQRITTLYDYLQFEENMENLFITPFSSDSISYINEIQVRLLSLSLMNQDIVDIALVNEQFSWSNLFNTDDLKNMQKKIGSTSSLSSLGITHSSFIGSDQSSYLTFGRNIFGFKNSTHYGKPLGNVIISIDPSKSSITLPNSEEADTYFMLVDQNLTIYPFNFSLDSAQPLLQECFAFYDFTYPPQSTTPFQLDTPNYIFYTSYIPSMDYYVISAIDKQKLYLDLINTRCLIFLIIFIVIVFMLLLMRVLLSSVITPLNHLYLFIKSIRKGNMKQLKHTILLEGSTEITTLSQEFNRMLGEITILNKQLFDTTTYLYEIELEKNKAEIAYLRSQINPHFLYNTLESIRGLALENNIPEIATISVAMGKMFRYSIKGDSVAPLSEELSIVKAYLDIQLIRFNHKFDVFYNIHPDTEKLQVPKMIIQPLVENAIFHGLERKIERSILYIGSQVTPNNELHITIQDDGVGISEDILSTLLSALSDSAVSSHTSKSHIGVLNVHNRIRLAYGWPYGLKIDSAQNLGTKITLILPKNAIEKRDIDA